MLLPTYDPHGRLYYPQYEDPPAPPPEPIRARRATTRSVCACIDDTLYVFQQQQQRKQSSMVVRQTRPPLHATSSIVPTSVLGPIPKWTGKPEGEKRGRSRQSSGREFERSRSRDIPVASKSREMDTPTQYHDVSIFSWNSANLMLISCPSRARPSCQLWKRNTAHHYLHWIQQQLQTTPLSPTLLPQIQLTVTIRVHPPSSLHPSRRRNSSSRVQTLAQRHCSVRPHRHRRRNSADQHCSHR
jgi:hypothetical protein